MVKLQNKTEEAIKTRMIENVTSGKEKFFMWKTIRSGEIVDAEPADEKQLLEKGLTLVKEVVAGKTTEAEKVDAESPEKDVDFEKELKSIKGIGPKTAKDIMAVYATKEELLKAIDKKEHIPIDDDVEELLKNHYGQEEDE